MRACLALRLKRSWTSLTLVAFKINFRLVFGIVNVTHSKSNPPHPYYLVLLKLKPFRPESFFRELVHHVPQLFLGICVEALEVDFVPVEDPIAWSHSILSFLKK